MKCPYCGAELPDSAKFCGYCGNKMPIAQEPISAAETQPAPEPIPAPESQPTPEPQPIQESQPIPEPQLVQEQQFNFVPLNLQPPEKKSKTKVIVFFVVLALVLGGGIFAIYKLASGDDSDSKTVESSKDKNKDKSPDKDKGKNKDKGKDKNKPEVTVKPENSSSDLFGFQVSLNGEVLTFPMTYDELVGMGWQPEEDLTAETLASTDYTYGIDMVKGDYTGDFTFFNPNPSTTDLTKCSIVGIDLDLEGLKQSNITAVLANDFQLESATVDSVIAAFGEPTDRYEGEYYISLEYTKEPHQSYEFSFSVESKMLEQLDIQNMVVDEDALKDALANVSQEKTERVKTYTSPSAPGDAASLIIELDGALHKLPELPVCVLLEQGWILSDSSDKAVLSGDNASIELTKGSASILCSVVNPEAEPVAIGNALIHSVSAYSYGDTAAPLKFFNSISLGMSKTDLESALSGLDYDMDDNYSSSAFYSLDDPDFTYSYSIAVDKETNTVNSISVHSYLH